jgi:Icc-related predicted phosphoesterase
VPTALCIADTHSNPAALRHLDARLALSRGTVDLVLAAGDITIHGHEPYAREFVACVRAHDVPLLVVHGNNDSAEVARYFREEGLTLHRQERTLFGHRFTGFGGDGNATHDIELQPGEMEQLSPEGSIFLTHIPPSFRIALSPVDGPKVPRSITGQLTEGGPRAHICGHIHHTQGVAYYAGTKIVKLRAAMWGSCALLDLDTLAVTFLPLDPDAQPRARRAVMTSR